MLTKFRQALIVVRSTYIFRITSFSITTRAYHINDFWAGSEIIKKNRNYVKKILNDAIPKGKIFLGVSYENFLYIQNSILDFYACNKYKIDEEERKLINQVFYEKADDHLKEYKKYLLERSEHDKSCRERLQKINNAEEQAYTVNGVRYKNRNQAELAEVEVKKIQQYYEESMETNVQKYCHLINQSFKTKAAQKEVENKEKELIEYIEYIKKNSKNNNDSKLKLSDLGSGLLWSVVGLIVFIKTGGWIGKVIAIACIIVGVNAFIDAMKENKATQDNTDRYRRQCRREVQKAFYSLIHERRVGEYHLPGGSIVVGAGNRTEDSAIIKTMSSALINRMFHEIN